MQRWWCFNKTN